MAAPTGVTDAEVGATGARSGATGVQAGVADADDGVTDPGDGRGTDPHRAPHPGVRTCYPSRGNQARPALPWPPAPSTPAGAWPSAAFRVDAVPVDALRDPVPVVACRGLRDAPVGHGQVDGMGFEVYTGEAYGLLGPPGSGKAAALRMVCGIAPPQGGAIRLGGRPMDGMGLDEVRGEVAYVPRTVVTMPARSFLDNLRYWARLTGVPAASVTERATVALARVGLDAACHLPAARRTAGELRRLGLAGALLRRPRLLALDDATARLGARDRDDLLATLAGLRDEGTALLYATTSSADVWALCDRVGLVLCGQLVAEGRPSGVL